MINIKKMAKIINFFLISNLLEENVETSKLFIRKKSFNYLKKSELFIH
jgi:hypothetical protein